MCPPHNLFVADWQRRPNGLSFLPVPHSLAAFTFSVHCEKSLFVLASRQKFPVLRTENPPVDTRTICLPPIEFFKIPHARKATAGKSRPKLQIRPENPGLLVP